MAKRLGLGHVCEKLAKIARRGGKNLSERDKILKHSFGAATISMMTQYRPEPSYTVSEPDKKGKLRKYCKPHHENKMLQKLLVAQISPVIEEKISPNCYNIKGRSRQNAIKQARKFVRQGYKYCIKLDIKNCYDSVDRQLLIHRIKQQDLFSQPLVDFMLTVTHVDNNPTGKGIPRGHPLSPLLLAIYFIPFTRFLDRRDICHCNFSDDFIFFFRTREEAREAYKLIRKYLWKKCYLKINKEKTRLGPVWGKNILGYELYQDKQNKARICIAESNIEQCKNEVEWTISNGFTEGNFQETLKEVNQYLKDWTNAFYNAQSAKQLKALDEDIVQLLLHYIDFISSANKWGWKKRYKLFRLFFQKDGTAKILASMSMTKESCNVFVKLRRKGVNTTSTIKSVYDAISLRKTKDKSEQKTA